MSNDTQCAVCGSPGMTQCESGRWLCRRHSPYTSSDIEPKYDQYLKQKGIEMALLFREIASLAESGDIEKIRELTSIKTLYHPLPFFLMLDKLDPYVKFQFLQDTNIFGYSSVYEPEEYLGADKTTIAARFYSKMVVSTESMTNLSLEAIMNLPGRIGYTHDDRFKGLPLLKQPSEEHKQCPKCKGHGFWNILLPGPGGRQLIQRCSYCNRIGWIGPDHTQIVEASPKNWLFDPKEKKFIQANARPSSIIGPALRQVREKSKIPMGEFSTKVSTFVGELITGAMLIDIEDGKLPLYDTVYVAVGEVSNSIPSW